MQKQLILVAALLAATPALFAQDDGAKKADAAQQGMPDPKVAEHDVLKSLAGTWECTVRTPAMPGVPGMEQASTSTAVENAELLCNGMWLTSSISGTFGGQPFEGLWLVGYDPQQKSYTSLWLDNHEATPCPMQGTYDAKTKTWTWSGNSSKGPSAPCSCRRTPTPRSRPAT